MSLDHSSRQRHPRFTIDDDDHESGTDTPARASTPDAGLRDEQKRAHDGDAFSEKRTEELKAAERTGGTGKAAEAFGEADGSSEEAVAPEKREDYPPSTSHSRSEDASPAATAEASTETTPNRLSRLRQRLLATSWLSWVEPHLCWRGMRPVLRASIASWCGLILMLVPRTQRMLGQASFLVLIVSVISPASAPIATALEGMVLQFFFVGAAWTWACIGLAIAHASRTKYHFTQAEFQQYAVAKLASAGISAAQVTKTDLQRTIFEGDYLEWSSSFVCALFLGVGCGALLWLRGYIGPGPFIFPLIFGVLLQCICLTTAVLFPYAYYEIGLLFVIPFACQQAINLAATFLVFPETLAHQFADRLIATLHPLQSVIQLQRGMLAANPRSMEWVEYRSIKAKSTAAMGGVALLAASESNLTREIAYARVSGKDLSKILGHMRVLVGKSTGFIRFHEIVEQHLHRSDEYGRGGALADLLVVRIGRSRPTSREHSPSSSRRASPTRGGTRSAPLAGSSDGDAADPDALSNALANVTSNPHRQGAHSPLVPISPRTEPTRGHSASHLPSRNSSSGSLADLAEHPAAPIHDSEHGTAHHSQHGHHYLHHHHHERHSRSKKRSRSQHRGHHGKSATSLPSLLHDVLHIDVPRPVGVFESQRYMDLEDYLSNPADEQHLEEIVHLLSTSSDALLTTLDQSVGHLVTTIDRLKRSEGMWRFMPKSDPGEEERAIAKSQEQLAQLEEALIQYRDVKRLEVITPFASLFDPFSHAKSEGDRHLASPSHRGLFWAMSYQDALLGWAEALSAVFKETVKVESKRRKQRIWVPSWANFAWKSHTDDTAAFEDENPDALDRLNSHSFNARRDPDFLPPQTTRHAIGVALYEAGHFLKRNDSPFAIKVALAIALVSMPAYFRSTANFFYRERGLWVLVMVALTSTAYVGDSAFGFVVRFFGTFVGALLGMLAWYIAAGSGHGSPYAVAAVVAVFLPFLMFYRVYFVPVISAIIPVITTMLVIGYSWQNAHQPALSSVGYGWDVAWRRCVCVFIGITIAFVLSYLPPKVTQKGTVRRTYSKVIAQVGTALCQTVSYAHLKGDTSRKPPPQIIANLATLRAKVGKTTARRAMIAYEPSLRGRWPAELYTSLQNLQMELLDLTGQLLGALAYLDAKWTRALLHRSQFSDPQFLGDLLTALQLVSAALENRTALPMLYNPLLERFLKPPEAEQAHRRYNFEVQLGDNEIDGLPTHVNLETICSLEYLKFSCGISQCYAIVNRIDRLMLVAKELVGESYIVYGLEDRRHRREEEDEERRWLGHEETPRSSMDSMV